MYHGGGRLKFVEINKAHELIHTHTHIHVHEFSIQMGKAGVFGSGLSTFGWGFTCS